LPETGFVFCSFNNAYKITSTIFDIWMSLLKQVDNSVLWLSTPHNSARANLLKVAARHGIDADRIVFAGRVERQEDHLGRLKLADLFLDTPIYNAHTTACDALWAGLPLVSCLGSTFAGRVGASILRAAGLPELVTTSLDDYEALALSLARNPDHLASIRAKLSAQRLSAPLFDTRQFTRHIEAAYATMWERSQRGETPEGFSVAP
jgi:predicted O-linked N-acetylglucosamine transferase (SPINDLY family)